MRELGHGFVGEAVLFCRMLKTKPILLAALVLLTACGDSAAPKTAPGVRAGDAASGLTAATTSCTSCHLPGGSSTVAPDWAAIQAAYRGDAVGLASYLERPVQHGPRMAEAVARFGTMPDMGISAVTARDLAAFILATDFTQPDWHVASGESVMSPLEFATGLARSTKGILGKNLMAALQSGGPAHAVPFCNERAIPLTDSMSTALGTAIRRVSDKPRNPDNRATGRSADYLATGHAALLQGSSVDPAIFEDSDGTYTAFVPIMTNNMCLQCHGDHGTTLTDETHQLILERYPEDQAVGYASNELRGAWQIQFRRD